MKYLGPQFDIGADPVADGDDVPSIIQQDVADLGRRIFVQFAADPDPSGPVRGDVRIREI